MEKNDLNLSGEQGYLHSPPRVSSGLILSAASVFTIANIVPPFSASGYITLLGCVLGGITAMSICLSLAEVQSTNPYKDGVWYFARMLLGSRAGFTAMCLDFFSYASLGVFFIRVLQKITDTENLSQISFRADSWGWFLICLFAALPFAFSVLYITKRVSCSILSRPAGWQKYIRWVSFFAISVGWGVFLCSLFFHDSPYTSPPGKLFSFREIIACLIRGYLLGLACFAAVPHSLPSRITVSAPNFDTADSIFDSSRYSLPRGMILGVLFTVLSAVVLSAALLGTGGDGISIRFTLVLFLTSYISIAAGLVFVIDRCCRTLGLMAREGLVPNWFNTCSSNKAKATKAFVFALPFTVLVLTLFYFSAQNPITSFVIAGIFQAFFGAFTCICQIWQRSDAGDETDYGFVMPGYFWAPAITAIFLILFTLFILFIPQISHEAIPVFILCLIGSVAMFESYGKIHSLAHSDDVVTIDEDDAETSFRAKSLHRRSLSILVADSSPESTYPLLDIAMMLSNGRTPWISHINLVKIPKDMSRVEAMRNMTEARETSDAILDWGRSHGTTVHTKIKLSRTVSRGILTTLRETRTDFLILAQKHPVKAHDTPAWGTSSDAILRRADCNVLIANRVGDGLPYKKILVPILNIKQSLFAIKTAVSLFKNRSNILITLFDPRGGISLRTPETRLFRLYAEKVNKTQNITIEIHDDFCGSIVDGVLEEILRGEHDLLILGIQPPQQACSAFILEALEPQIAGRCKIPTIVVTEKKRFSWKGISL